MATPSIAMIPSGYKATKVYSVLPTNGDGDLTFNRDSIARRVNKSGLIEEMATDVPRLDYSDGSCPSLLLEPASLNLATYSQDFSDTSWIATQSTLTPNTVISPDGTLTASTLTSNGSSSQIAKNSTGVIGSEYTVSFYIKRKTGSGLVAIKAVENINTNISVTNEWQRFSFTATATSTSIFSGVRLFTTGDEVYIWGAQVEEKSFATSYIPTSSQTQSRSADSASKTGLSSYINDSEGVLYAEISALGDDLTFRNISLSNSSILNRIYIRYLNVSNRIQALVDVGGVNQVSITQVVSDITLNTKVAFRYKANDFSLFINGTKYIGTPLNDGSVPSGLNRLGFDYGIAGADFYGKAKDVRVYNTVLTDAELATLTTI